MIAWKIAAHEYKLLVLKPMFWIASIGIPLFLVGIVILSSLMLDKYDTFFLDSKIDEMDTVFVFDETGIVRNDEPPIVLVQDVSEGMQGMQEGEANAFFHFMDDNRIDIYIPHENILANMRFDTIAIGVVRNAILSEMEERRAQILAKPYDIRVTAYSDDGVIVDDSWGSIAIPVLLIFLYFTVAMAASGYLLMSVTAEKENRMMEVFLTLASGKQIMSGKIISLFGVVATQLTVLLILASPAIVYISFIDEISFDVGQMVLAGVYFALGLMILCNIVIALGAAVPSQHDAQHLFSIVTALMFVPLIVIGNVLANPSGIFSVVLSYIPVVAPVTLMIRNGLEPLSLFEIVASVIVLALYLAVSWQIAVWTFHIGAMKYNDRISLSDMLGRTFSRSSASSPSRNHKHIHW